MPAEANPRLMLLAAAAIASAYALAYLNWYAGTPLGRVPLLDAREVLDLALAIKNNTLPAEPFYRAPLYAALVAWLSPMAQSAQDLLGSARFINIGSHVATAVLIAATAQRVWRSNFAGLISGLLFAAYPVAIYFTGDAGDTSLGMALFAAALWFMAPKAEIPAEHSSGTQSIADDSQPASSPAWAAFFLALATTARPQYATVLVFWLLLVAWAFARKRLDRQHLLASVAAAGLVLGTLAFANWRISGDPMVLPWQGAYAAWTANSPDSNGRFFEQHIAIVAQGEHRNPTRVESEVVYRMETGDKENPTPRANQAYWYGRFYRYVGEHPLAWLRLMAEKVFYLANDIEQYDNKTYAVQKAASPWLDRNPLGFSVLLAAALIGLLIAPFRSSTLRLAGALLVFLGGVAVFFVSGRYRLPAVVILAILAGGIAVADPGKLARRLKERAAAGLAGMLLLTISLWPAPVDPKPTAVEDAVLLASAASELGLRDEAARAAEHALSLAPEDRHARSTACLAYLNQALLGLPQHPAGETAWRRIGELCSSVADSLPLAAHIAAIADWQLGNYEAATARWQQLLSQAQAPQADVVAALLMTGGFPADKVQATYSPTMPQQLALALALRGRTDISDGLLAAHGASWMKSESARLNAQFPPRKPVIEHPADTP